ncbi:MAG: DUF1376 domain-containing protein [Gammaproteobacteria bacterium]
MHQRRDSNNLPAMPWYSTDFRRDTNLLSRPAKLLYRELIDLYWEHRGELIFEPERLALAVGCPLDEWHAAWPEVAPFWQLEEASETGKHRLSNARAKHELRFVQQRVMQRREAGRKGGRASAAARWNTPSDKGIVTTAYSPAYSETPSETQANGSAAEPAKRNPPRPRPRSKTPPPLSEAAPPKGEASPDEEKPRKSASPGAPFDPLAMALPEGVSVDAWREWVHHRRELRKPLTERAARMALNTLERLEDELPEAVIARSIQAGWTGLFPDKRAPPGTALASAPAPEIHPITGAPTNGRPLGHITRSTIAAFEAAERIDAARAAHSGGGGGGGAGALANEAFGLQPIGRGDGHGDSGDDR